MTTTRMHDDTLRSPAATESGSAMTPRRWQIVSRPNEFATIRSTLTDPAAGGIMLVGAAGVGKTTLARAVTDSLGNEVRWVAATESARSVPLGVFAHLVGTTTSRDPVALLSAARDALAARDDAVVGIDDAHLLDNLSATLLHQIALDRAARVVCTVRSGEPVPDAVTSLWKDGYLQRVELGSFTKTESVGLIETELGGEIEEFSADVMWQSSGGNALYLRHLVEGGLDAGTLTPVNGIWQLRGDVALTAGLTTLLELRLRRVGAGVRAALEFLALCEPLAIEVLCELAGDAPVEEAEVRELIRVVADGDRTEARFAHPLLGEVVRSNIGTVAARRRRGALVRALRGRETATAAGRIRVAQLCLHSDEAVDAELLTRAAKDAISLYDLPLCERLGRAALAAGAGLAAAVLVSRALIWQGNPAAAEQILARVAPDDLDELELVRWGVPRLSILFWNLGEVDRAHEVLDQLDVRVRHQALQLIVAATRSGMAVHENRIEEALRIADDVLARPDAPKQAVEWAVFTCGLGLPLVGRADEFAPIFARVPRGQRITDGMINYMVHYCDVTALAYLGELDTAQRRADEYAQFTSAGEYTAWAISRIMTAAVDIRRGLLSNVIREVEQAIAALNAEASLPWLLPGRLLLIRAYAGLGRGNDAARVLQDAGEHIGEFMALYGPQLVLARAWVAAASGSTTLAIELAGQAADAAVESGQHAVAADALHDAARFGDRGAARRFDGLADFVRGALIEPQVRHARAVADGDGSALDAASADFETLGLLLSAADAAAQAASAHERAGRKRATAESSARAFRLAAACGGAETPAVRSAAHPLPLTIREREIATLIAAGLSNTEIAQRLFLSVRTVEGHIYRACTKLDLTDRGQLGDLIRRPDDSS